LATMVTVVLGLTMLAFVTADSLKLNVSGVVVLQSRRGTRTVWVVTPGGR
jgi:hypothetical protein